MKVRRRARQQVFMFASFCSTRSGIIIFFTFTIDHFRIKAVKSAWIVHGGQCDRENQP